MAFGDFFVNSLKNYTQINLDIHSDCEESNNSTSLKICCLDSIGYSNFSQNNSEKNNFEKKKYFYYYLSFGDDLIYDFNFIGNNSPPVLEKYKKNHQIYINLTGIIKSNT